MLSWAARGIVETLDLSDVRGPDDELLAERCAELGRRCCSESGAGTDDVVDVAAVALSWRWRRTSAGSRLR